MRVRLPLDGKVGEQEPEVTEDQVALAARLAYEVHQLHQVVTGDVSIEALIEREVSHG